MGKWLIYDIDEKGHWQNGPWLKIKDTWRNKQWNQVIDTSSQYQIPNGTIHREKTSFPKFMEMNRSCERPLIASPSLLDPGFYTWLSTANEKEHADPWKRGKKASLEIHTKKLLFLLLQRQSLKQSCCSSAKPGKGRYPLHFSFLSTSSTTLWWRGGGETLNRCMRAEL